VSHDDFPDLASGGEYGVVRMPDAWHVLSLLCFLAALGARFVTALIPHEMSPMYYRPILTAYSIPLLGAVGILFGLFGLRHPEGRSAARIALFLNGVVLVLGSLGIAAVYWILPQ
jgi:hypothetical protein